MVVLKNASFVFFFCIAVNVYAQDASVPKNDEEISELDAIVVTAPSSRDRVQPPRQRLSNDAIKDRQPKLISDALRGIAGVSIRPNSRGESVVRIRGSEERQTAVFLDGAPLSVPWDGRVDLGVIPASLINNITVAKGAVPIEYGANAVAGAVDINTRRGGETIEAEISAGSESNRSLSFLAEHNIELSGSDSPALETMFAVSQIKRNAQTIANIDALPFSQANSSSRTNTDLDSRSVFTAAGMTHEAMRWRVSLLHAEVERGIAPEANLNPAVNAPRYWRYPDWQLTQLNVNTEITLANETLLRAVFWRQWFEQTIDAYRTQNYDALRSRELDEDNTSGLRFTFTHPLGPVKLRYSASLQHSQHDQTDIAFPSEIAGQNLRYEQRLSSVGVELDWPLTDSIKTTFGVGYDRASTPLTGDKPTLPASDAPTYSAALAWQINPNWRMNVSGGKRTRFASARELYGEALGRFLINPDLRPETSELLDVEFAWQSKGQRFSINPFYQINDDAIAQSNVIVGGQSLRQRINLAESRAIGMDFYLALSPYKNHVLELGGGLLNTKISPTSAFPFNRLPQRPEYEVFAAWDWLTSWHSLDMRTELRRTGGAFDIGPTGTAIKLKSGTEVNFRATLPLMNFSEDRSLDLILSIDNVTNTVVEPQLGLPQPGRTFNLGLKFGN